MVARGSGVGAAGDAEPSGSHISYLSCMSYMSRWGGLEPELWPFGSGGAQERPDPSLLAGWDWEALLLRQGVRWYQPPATGSVVVAVAEPETCGIVGRVCKRAKRFQER